jgi:hypothetical protein
VGDEPNPLAWFQDQCHESSLSGRGSVSPPACAQHGRSARIGDRPCVRFGWLSGRSRRGARHPEEARWTSPRLRRRRTAPDQHVGVEVEVARPGQRPCLDPDLAKAAIPQVRGRHPAPDQGARTAGLLWWRLTLPIMRASGGVWLRSVPFRGEAAPCLHRHWRDHRRTDDRGRGTQSGAVDSVT